jgi:hypothetical protein
VHDISGLTSLPDSIGQLAELRVLDLTIASCAANESFS